MMGAVVMGSGLPRPGTLTHDTASQGLFVQDVARQGATAVRATTPTAHDAGPETRSSGELASAAPPHEGTAVLSQETDMDVLLHSLSQPLTSISLALGIAAAPITEEERERVLKTAQSECLRAMHQVQALRGMVNATRRAGVNRPDGGA